MNGIIFRETLPDFWVAPLLHGDYSVFIGTDNTMESQTTYEENQEEKWQEDTEEIKQIQKWQEDHKGWICIDVEGESSFYINHDASHHGVLACNCLTFVFMLTTEN